MDKATGPEGPVPRELDSVNREAYNDKRMGFATPTASVTITAGDPGANSLPLSVRVTSPIDQVRRGLTMTAGRSWIRLLRGAHSRTDTRREDIQGHSRASPPGSDGDVPAARRAENLSKEGLLALTRRSGSEASAR